MDVLTASSHPGRRFFRFSDWQRRGLLLKLLVMFVAPLIVFALPAGFFDSGQTICLSRLLLDISCPGCGMTRAIQHLIHLDTDAALAYNPLSFVVLPLLVYVWLSEVLKIYRSLNVHASNNAINDNESSSEPS